LRLRHVGVDGTGEAALVDAPLEAREVQAQVAGIAQQVRALEAWLLGEQPVVIRPVPALVTGAAGGFVGGTGEIVEGQRQVPEDETDPAVVLLQDRAQRPLDLLAVGSLVVGELHDGHRRVRRSLGHGRIEGGRRPGRGDGGAEEQGGQGQGVHSPRNSAPPHVHDESQYAGDHPARNVPARQGAARRRLVGFLLRILVNAGAIYLAASLVPGVELRGVGAAVLAGLVLGLVNAVVRPVLVLLTLPLTLLTLGLFLFVLNAVCLWLASALVPGFEIRGFGAAFLGALLVSVVSWLLTAFVADSGRLARL
jgi:putative membrane protein